MMTESYAGARLLLLLLPIASNHPLTRTLQSKCEIL